MGRRSEKLVSQGGLNIAGVQRKRFGRLKLDDQWELMTQSWEKIQKTEQDHKLVVKSLLACYFYPSLLNHPCEQLDCNISSRGSTQESSWKTGQQWE